MTFARLLRAATALLLALVPKVAAAQSQGYVGKWDVDLERGMRVENGVPTPVMGKCVLTVRADADSLVVSIDMGARPDGTVTPLSTVGGHMMSGNLVFVQRIDAQMTMNGQTMASTATMTWTVKVEGDALSGSIIREIANVSLPITPSPLKGVRMKS